jgi:hypothetical protein
MGNKEIGWKSVGCIDLAWNVNLWWDLMIMY